VEFFRQRGGAETGDNFVSRPYADAQTVEDFMTYLSTAMPGLSEDQRASLKAVYGGPVNPVTGEQIYNGMPMGSEIYGGGFKECQGAESPYFFPFIWAFGENYNGRDFDFAGDMDRIHEMVAADLNANNPDLSAFRDHGGKLLAFSGSADPCVPYPDAMAYYNRAVKAMGGLEATQEFYRFFLIPGKDHSHLGRGATAQWGEGRRDLLTLLRRWREEGVAPESMTAARVEVIGDEESVHFQRELRPYEADLTPGSGFPATCSERYL